jgi:hypothetical protein
MLCCALLLLTKSSYLYIVCMSVFNMFSHCFFDIILVSSVNVLSFLACQLIVSLKLFLLKTCHSKFCVCVCVCEWVSEWERERGGVKCTLVQALRLCTGCMAHSGSRYIALPFHDRCTRRGWEVSVTPRPLFTPGKDPVPIIQEARWAPGPVRTGAENLGPSGMRPPVRPAHS